MVDTTAGDADRIASAFRPSPLRSTSGIVLVGAMLILISVLVFGLFEEANRRARMREAEARIMSLAAILSEHAGRILDVANLAASQAIAVKRGKSWDEIERSREAHDALKRLQDRYEYISALWLVDAAGAARLSTRWFPTQGTSVADRRHFQVQREGDAGPYLSELMRSRVMPEVNAVLSRRINEPDGGFGGVALAVLNPAYLLASYGEIQSRYPLSVELVRFDRSILVRSPAASPDDALYERKTTGPDMTATDVWQGVFTAPDPRDGTLRLQAFDRIEGFPLYIVVGVGVDDVIRHWLAAMAGHGAFAGAALLAALAGLAWAHRHGVRAERALDQVRALRRSLEQRVGERTQELERVLREENHRVKNSLQLAASLLLLQQAKAAAAPVRQLLGHAHRRVLTIARLHEHLHQADSVATVDLRRYLTPLCDDIAAAIGPGGGPARVACDIASVTVAAETAVPLGLILNELMTNAIKHGLAAASGTITVSLTTADGIGRLVVTDTGSGLPAGFALDRSPGLGLQIVQGLAQQIGGTVTAATRPQGATFTVEFALGAPGIQVERNKSNSPNTS